MRRRPPTLIAPLRVEAGGAGSNPLAGLLDSLTGSMSVAPGSVGGGTFSGMASRIIAGGDHIAKQQLDFLKQIATNTEKSERHAREGIAFAP